MTIEEQEFDALIPYWKPLENVEYNAVVFTSWKAGKGNFGNELQMKIVAADKDQFIPEKDFNTKSSSFITQIKPIILNAQSRGYQFIAVSLKYSGKKYTLFDRTDEMVSRAKAVANLAAAPFEKKEHVTPTSNYSE